MAANYASGRERNTKQACPRHPRSPFDVSAPHRLLSSPTVFFSVGSAHAPADRLPTVSHTPHNRTTRRGFRPRTAHRFRASTRESNRNGPIAPIRASSLLRVAKFSKSAAKFHSLGRLDPIRIEDRAIAGFHRDPTSWSWSSSSLVPEKAPAVGAGPEGRRGGGKKFTVNACIESRPPLVQFIQINWS